SSAPVWPRAPTIPTVFPDVAISVDQGRFPLCAMRRTAGDRFEVGAKAVPEDLEIRFLEAPIRLLVIERIDTVPVTRAPEQPRVFGVHHLPDRATQTF